MLINLPMEQQAILFLASLILFTSFILLAQTRVLSMVNAFAAQGILVAITTAVVAFATSQHHLYISAVLTLALKAMFIPWFLHRLVHQLKIDKEPHKVDNPAFVLMAGAALVIFCYYVTLPITQFTDGITRNTIVISMAVVLLGMLMLVTRNKAVAQVIGFMSLENGLFFAAVAATHGMPMVVELGIAFDVLVAAIIFGVFFFHIRESIDSLDVNQLSRLSENDEE